MLKVRQSAAIIALVVAAAFAAPSAAQTPSPPAKPAPAAPPGAKPPAISGQRFGAWVLACPPPEQANATCVLLQQLSEALSRKVVFVWLIRYDKGALLGTFHLPSGVFVDRGLIMKTDPNGDGLKVDYTRCDPNECQAVFSMTNDLVKQLSGAENVTVAIALTNGKTVDVDLSMDGFTGGLAALAAKAKGAKE